MSAVDARSIRWWPQWPWQSWREHDTQRASAAAELRHRVVDSPEAVAMKEVVKKRRAPRRCKGHQLRHEREEQDDQQTPQTVQETFRGGREALRTGRRWRPASR